MMITKIIHSYSVPPYSANHYSDDNGIIRKLVGGVCIFDLGSAIAQIIFIGVLIIIAWTIFSLIKRKKN